MVTKNIMVSSNWSTYVMLVCVKLVGWFKQLQNSEILCRLLYFKVVFILFFSFAGYMNVCNEWRIIFFNYLFSASLEIVSIMVLFL